MEKLISMVEFVLNEANREFYLTDAVLDHANRFDSCFKYAKFLSQPLTLSMFVPCDQDGNVLEEPIQHRMFGQSVIPTVDEKMYIEAQSKVLFEGFEVCDRMESVKCVVNDDFHFSYESAIKNGQAIESLVKYGLTLTPHAKQLIFG